MLPPNPTNMQHDSHPPKNLATIFLRLHFIIRLGTKFHQATFVDQGH